MKKKKALDRIFGSSARVAVLGCLFFDRRESYIRELSKKLNISPSAVKREVDILEEAGIIKKEDKRVILNEDSIIVNDLKNIFLKTDFVLYPIREALSGKKIEFAFVFGSFARGDYEEKSDVDLMVVGEITLEEVIKKISSAEKKIRRDINPVVWTAENLKKEKESGFVRDIFKKGVLMVKGDENELRRIVE